MGTRVTRHATNTHTDKSEFVPSEQDLKQFRGRDRVWFVNVLYCLARKTRQHCKSFLGASTVNRSERAVHFRKRLLDEERPKCLSLRLKKHGKSVRIAGKIIINEKQFPLSSSNNTTIETQYTPHSDRFVVTRSRFTSSGYPQRTARLERNQQSPSSPCDTSDAWGSPRNTDHSDSFGTYPSCSTSSDLASATA